MIGALPLSAYKMPAVPGINLRQSAWKISKVL